MATMKSGILVVAILFCEALGGVEQNVENGRQKHDHLQEEILAAMKDSGVLKEWKEKLDDMLYKENEVDPNNLPKAQKRSMINKAEKDMLRSFVEEYKTDQQLTVSTELILGVIERVQKTPKPNLPQIFVQLGPVISVLAAISQKTSDVQKIVDRQAPIFDSPAKPKDILHTLAENLKSELVRLTLDSKPIQKKPPQPKKPSAKPAAAPGLGLSDYLTLGSTLLKGGNGAEMMKMMSGEADMSSMLTLLPQLMQQGNVKDLLMKMVGTYLGNTPYGAIIQQYGSSFLESEQGSKFVDGFYSAFETFVKSESWKRLTALVPQLMAAKDMEAMLNVLTKEAESNWGMFFDSIENSDYKENIMDTIATYLVKGYDFFQNIPSNSMFAQAPLLVNGLLISYRLPAFDTRSPLDSITKILAKSIKLYSPWKKLDITPHAKMVTDSLTQAYQTQAKGNKFSKLGHEEKKALIARVLDAEIVSPVQTVWGVYSHATSQPKCTENLLCLVNYHELKSNQGQTRLAVMKGSSLAAAWALSQSSKDVYWRLYKAVWAGTKGDDCMVTYPVKGNTCQIFQWQKQSFMNTQYDHVEL
eukprot:TRINITY_DN361_c0_g1_i1.p1 TRINITY_DN361_c0_g1~~TRINITY_DN361_c0_g1_i1.p1  ORF type:complete len:585 (-),score=128.04 TRINITY_DN361_c0_g1_i1:212-1966(-)